MVKKLLFMSGLLLFICVILSLFFINFNFGTIILFVASCFLILYGIFYKKLIKMKWLTYGILSGCFLLLLMMLSIGIYGNSDNATFEEDAVIVLGAGIRGEQVSLTLSYRLDSAVKYYEKNPEAIIIVSGGQGPQEDITEALAMERYLIDKGVPKESIIREEASTSTYENMLFSKKLLDGIFNNQFKTVIITNDFHIFRATRTAERLGLDVTHFHAKTKWYSIPLNYLRECFAIFKFYVLRNSY